MPNEFNPIDALMLPLDLAEREAIVAPIVAHQTERMSKALIEAHLPCDERMQRIISFYIRNAAAGAIEGYEEKQAADASARYGLPECPVEFPNVAAVHELAAPLTHSEQYDEAARRG